MNLDVIGLIAEFSDECMKSILNMVYFDKIDPDLATKAAKCGYLDILIWARNEGFKWNSSVCSSAALNGHLNIIKYARENGCQWNVREECELDVCSSASINGHLEVIVWARENGCSWSKDVNIFAALNGHLNVVKYFNKHFDKYGYNVTLPIINYESGHLKVLLEIFYNGYEAKPDICLASAEGGHKHILEWAESIGHKIDEYGTALAAAGGGHLEILDWLVSEFGWDSKFSRFAAANGHLNILKWAKSKGYELGDICSAAASYDQNEIIIWAKDNNRNWTSLTCALLAERGNLEMLKFVRANGCEWCQATPRNVCGGGFLEMIKWIKENSKEWDSDEEANKCSAGPMKQRGKWSDHICLDSCWGEKVQLNVLKWARENGCKFDDKRICEYGHKLSVNHLYLAANNCPCGKYSGKISRPKSF